VCVCVGGGGGRDW
jgi:hypothetical protein